MDESPAHRQGETVLSALGERTGYVMNPDKTEDGELGSSYECDPATAQAPSATGCGG